MRNVFSPNLLGAEKLLVAITHYRAEFLWTMQDELHKAPVLL